MSASQNDRDKSPPPPDTSTVILLLGTIADTTWRMFVPTLLGATIGYWADTKFSSDPWLGLVGLVVGVLFTTVLIRKQLKDVANNS